MEFSSQLLCCLPYGHLVTTSIAARSPTSAHWPIRISDGWFTPPDQPGHGIVFGRAVLAAHAVES